MDEKWKDNVACQAQLIYHFHLCHFNFQRCQPQLWFDLNANVSVLACQQSARLPLLDVKMPMFSM